jgi:hypothetical protein
MLGGVDRIEELGIAPGAADIFWTTAPGGLDEARVSDAGPAWSPSAKWW